MGLIPNGCAGAHILVCCPRHHCICTTSSLFTTCDYCICTTSSILICCSTSNHQLCSTSNHQLCSTSNIFNWLCRLPRCSCLSAELCAALYDAATNPSNIMVQSDIFVAVLRQHRDRLGSTFAVVLPSRNDSDLFALLELN